MYHFIVNPASSSGQGKKLWERIEQTLKDEQIPYKAHLSLSHGEASSIAEQISLENKNCILVVVGGDGTINEVINGIHDFSHITFGCIPTGSGNDFCRGLKLTADTQSLLRIILHPHRIRPVDLWQVESKDQIRRFVISCGMGYDAAISNASLDSPLKRFLNRFHIGSLIYTINGLLLLISMKRQPIQIQVDDKAPFTCRNGYFSAFMNLPYEGGGYKFAPAARPTDGKLDLCCVDRLPKIIVPFLFPLANKGKHGSVPGVRLIKCQNISVTNPQPLYVHTDGETFGCLTEIRLSHTGQKLKTIVG